MTRQQHRLTRGDDTSWGERRFRQPTNTWHTTEKAARQRLTRAFFRGQAFPRRRNVKIAVGPSGQAKMMHLVGLFQTFLAALGMHSSQRVPLTASSDHHHSEADRKGPHLNQKLDVL